MAVFFSVYFREPGRERLLGEAECPRMKLDDFGEVSQEIGQAMVARVQMILVLHSFFLELFVESGGPFFKTVVVILAAVEIDGHPPQCRLILIG